MKCLVLINHNLTENQISDLRDNWNCKTIVFPNEQLKYAWSHIPATKDFDFSTVELISAWWKDVGIERGDLFLVQGEMGMTYAVVDFAKTNRLVPIYAISQRVSSEVNVGGVITKESKFEHVCFKEYKGFGDLAIERFLKKVKEKDEDKDYI